MAGSKLYYRIKEVAHLLGEQVSTLRHWESEFPHLAPAHCDKGARRYTQQDIENIRTVQYLLRVRKFTIEGAQDELKRTKKRLDTQLNTLTRLRQIRERLLELRAQLES